MVKCRRHDCENDVLRRGRALYCSDACRAKVNDKKYIAGHKDIVNERRRLKYKQNPQPRLVRNKQYRDANAKRLNAKLSMYYKAHPEKRRAKNRKRRALMSGINHEPYQNNYVFERDGRVCQICGRKINKRLKYPNPLCGSVDHIVPLSKGGDDRPGNVQASHLRCNLGKHAQNTGQLRLFG